MWNNVDDPPQPKTNATPKKSKKTKGLHRYFSSTGKKRTGNKKRKRSINDSDEELEDFWIEKKNENDHYKIKSLTEGKNPRDFDY